MEAKDWEFDRFVGDSYDLEAEVKAANRYFGNVGNLKLKPGEDTSYAFSSGFFRGCAWMRKRLMRED